VVAPSVVREDTQDMYSMACSALWPAVKMPSATQGSTAYWHRQRGDDVLVCYGGTLGGKRINSAVLNAKGDTCELQVQTAYSGLIHDDAGDFKKRVDESLAKLQPSQPAPPRNRTAPLSNA